MRGQLEEMIKVPGVYGFEVDIRDLIISKIKASGLKAAEDNLRDLGGSAMQDFGSLMMPIGTPTRYTHSPTEYASIPDMQNASRLVANVAERIAREPKSR